jgi:phosphoadenosine phosphosulfate reductase
MLVIAGRPMSGSDPVQLLKWAAERFTSRIALTCSFGGAGGLVLAHMIHEHDLDIPVLFIDTGFLFPETYALKETFARRYNLTIRVVRPNERNEPMIPNLWERDPDACCHLRKVEPMQRALAQLDAWVCALRRDQAPTRKDIDTVEDHLLPNGRRICKINPLAYWTHAQVWGYIMRHNVPYNPLSDQGYRSIGCIQCTQPTVAGTAARSGRWPGSNKIECGLHTFTDRLEVPPEEP